MKSAQITTPENSRSAQQLLHALIVEDNPTDAELMVHELRRSGFEVTWERVDTEADYLTHLRKSPGVVLADYALPQFSGLQALQLLQEEGLSLSAVSGLFLSSLERQREETRRNGERDRTEAEGGWQGVSERAVR